MEAAGRASASAVEEAVYMRIQRIAEAPEMIQMIRHHQRQCHLCQVEGPVVGRIEGYGSAV
jgi:hypothetical protein